MKNIRPIKHNPSLQIIVGFIILILLGSFLLSLPLSNKNGEWLNFVDALFTSTSAVCVTGLTVVDTTAQFTLLGKSVIMLLIQIGGLGIVTLTSIVFLMLRKKVSFNNRIALQESINKDSMLDLLKFIKKTIILTFIIEGIGALLLLYSTIKFSGSFGLGLFYAVFMSVSSFCNAGFDVLGSEGQTFASLYGFASDITLLLPIIFLMVLGGIGFVVLIDGFKNFRNRQHTKIVLLMTAILLFGGTFALLLCEWNNPNTIGNMSNGDKLLNALFQSASARTCGAATFDHNALTPMGRLTIMLMMFIGGSPNSMAGGIKTTTLFVLLIFIIRQTNSKGDIRLKEKQISHKMILKALKTFLYCFFSIFIAVVIISLIEPNYLGVERILFECISALSTTGFSMGITPTLTNVSKLILCLLMFIGRVEITTIVMAASTKTISIVTEEIEYPTTDIIV